ncbi:type I secretion system permease/ATPase [Marinomonas pollencensis]|uniref:ATP-binding cassette subfamily C protein LapB n=1 Tax=Marinomonas pollencensis TaxID=491954 RepID=A0A3E0DN80_9GAMM|nr:type I secretion system permease/ATPase [Marinomonas pollencensis]REG84173.1 ATP-binding cassette subfamily C protein LapB [Marinomonas pollencensis]
MSDSTRTGQDHTTAEDAATNAQVETQPTDDTTKPHSEASEEAPTGAQQAQWQVAGSDLEYPNPLLDCLVLLSKYFHNPYSADSIAAGLPITDNDMTPALFKRAAQRIGISSRFIKRPLLKIPSMVLPAVLLLKDHQACVLLSIDHQNKTATVMRPEAGEGEFTLSLDELMAAYSGYCFFVKPIYQFDKRSEKESEKASKKHWFWGTITRSWRIYRDVFIASLLINVFAVASPLFVMNVYDRVVPNNAFDTLWVLAIGATVVYMFDFLLRTLRAYFIDIAGKKSDILISASIFSKVNNITMASRPQSVGAFAKNLQEFESIRDFITSASITTLVDIPFMFLIVGVIWLIGGPVGYIPIITIFLILMYSVIIQVPLRRSIEESQKTASQKNAVLIESLYNAESVKLNNAEGVLQQKWETAVGNIADWGVKTRQLAQSSSSFAAMAQQLTTVVIVIVGVYQISEGNMSMGALVASVMLTGRALGPMAQVAGLATRYNQAKSAFTSLNEIMNSPVENPDDVKFVHRPKFDGAFQFDAVSFAYPEQEQAAISAININIKPGEKVGIIGRIGSGKSTLGKLMTGLYTPMDGAVRVDGVDVRQINPTDLRRNVGSVSQDVTLFYGSIRDNIVMGVPYMEDEAILRAAELSGVSEFANRKPSGLDSIVGERGMQLSGGQRQSIAIARALLFDPPILILDEPTASMDNTTETRMKRRLMNVVKDKTLILITHKASMLDMVDRIIVMDNGRLIADGPKAQVHEALRQGKLKVS